MEQLFGIFVEVFRDMLKPPNVMWTICFLAYMSFMFAGRLMEKMFNKYRD